VSIPPDAIVQPVGNPMPAPSAPPPQPTGRDLEDMARARLRRLIGLRVDVTAPTWNQILFASQKIPMRVESPPGGVLNAIDQLPPQPAPPGSPADPVRTESEMLLKQLSDARPRGSSPRSIACGPRLPPPQDALSAWIRRVFLVVTGPEACRLLVAAGYLQPGDVDVLEVVYPKGLDEERQAAVGAAINLTNAAMRNGVPHDLPSWLNDQMLTLMDEKRPIDVYRDVYDAEDKAQKTSGPSPSSAQPNLIAQQSEPKPATDR